MPIPAGKKLSQADAKAKCLEKISAGATVAEAVKAVDRTVKWHENMRALDKTYAGAIDAARSRRDRAKQNATDPDVANLSFAEWRKRYLNRDTYPHMQNLIDVVEGNDPSWLHPSMRWEPAARDRIAINIPVYHAKSQTLTVDWVTYALCMNPDLQILIVSKKQDQAKKFLYQIKQRLISNLFVELQEAYAPPEGFRGEGAEWSSNKIYLAGRNSDEKDPSIEAIGLGGQIYGNRADIIILDDCVTLSNASLFESQINWLESEVENRVFNGKIVIIGTRLAPQDLYSEILKGDRYMSGASPWSYLAMPMVLEEAPEPKDWVTLWPASSTPMDRNATDEPDENGMYPAWDGVRAAKTRASKPVRTWELVYQQRSVSSDMIFPPQAVWAAVQRRRKPGPLRAGGLGHPRNGAEGYQIILSIDTAGTGEAFILCYAVNRVTGDRLVLNCWMGNHTRISWYADIIEQVCPDYGVTLIVVEKNAYASWLITDERVTKYCMDRGIRIIPHFTGNNKQDPDFGVATLGPLFGTLTPRIAANGTGTGQFDHAGDNKLEIPDPDYSPGVMALIQQLLTWVPNVRGGKLRQDGPMTLWFAELQARLFLTGGERPNQSHSSSNRFLSPRAASRQGVTPAGYSY